MVAIHTHICVPASPFALSSSKWKHIFKDYDIHITCWDIWAEAAELEAKGSDNLIGWQSLWLVTQFDKTSLLQCDQ